MSVSPYLVSLQCLNRAAVGCTWMQQGTQHHPWVGPVLLSTPHSHWSPHLLQNQPKPKNTLMQCYQSVKNSLFLIFIYFYFSLLCNWLWCHLTHLSWWPAAREEISIIIAMKRDVQDARIAVEHFLGAIAVVNVLATIILYIVNSTGHKFTLEYHRHAATLHTSNTGLSRLLFLICTTIVKTPA